MASLSWNEFSATALLEFRMTKTGVIFGGITAGSIDAQYREQGTTITNISEGLDNKNTQGPIFGFRYNVNRLEFLSISYQDAVVDGVTLQFRKLF